MVLGRSLEAQPLNRLRLSVRGLANWILDYADRQQLGVTNMALNKLLFFSLEKALIERGELLTEARIEAWDHGPVFREVYHAFKQHGDKPIRSRVEFYSTESQTVERSKVTLSTELATFLAESITPLLSLSASTLRNMSHIPQGAWHLAWNYEGHANPGMEITPASILAAAGIGGSYDDER